MGLTKTTKNAIDFTAPTVGAGILCVVMFRYKVNWKIILGAAAIAWLLLYLVTTQLTRVAALQGPAPVPTGGGCDDYDPKALMDSIHEDLTCTLCFRKENLYTDLLALADCQLIKCYNYWNANFYPEDKQSLPKAIAAPGTWTSLSGTFTNQLQPQCADRFKTLSLQ